MGATTNDMPDYLAQALANEEKMGNPDVFANERRQTPRIRRIEIPQRNSQTWVGAFGSIIINDDNDAANVEEVQHLDFLLVDSLVWHRLNAVDWMWENPVTKSAVEAGGVGGRTMWQFDNEGRRVSSAQRPVCSTPNGFLPWFSNDGQEVYDYRMGVTHKIGYAHGENGVEKVDFPCLTCPFGQWVTKPDGSKAPPMCRETFTYIVWDIDRRELMSIKGVNVGNQLALVGHRGNTGRRYDGQELLGIQNPFSYIGKLDGTDTPCFRNRPEGRPTMDNPHAPVYAARLTVSLNNFTPPTAITEFTLLDGEVESIPVLNPEARPQGVDGGKTVEMGTRQLTDEEYAAYLQMVSTVYSQDGWRDLFMFMGLAEQRLNALPAPTAQQSLPSGDMPEEIPEDAVNPF
jgi:hypothetical protein